jgi:ribosome modulation factor
VSAKPAPCPGGCDHSDKEHRAFDRGVAAGEAGEDEAANPYVAYILRHAWITGHSVGRLNRTASEGSAAA